MKTKQDSISITLSLKEWAALYLIIEGSLQSKRLNGNAVKIAKALKRKLWRRLL